MSQEKPLVSFVVACYHSEQTLAGVVDDIVGSLPSSNFDIEVILIDDGSTDATFEVIKETASIHPGVSGFRLSKNFGQQHAMLAGFRKCNGHFIVYCDDDGQSPVADIHKLIAPLVDSDEFDMVWASYATPNGSPLKRLGSYLNELMARKLIKKPKDLEFGNLWVARRYVIDEVVKCENPFLYLGGMFLSVTNRMTNVRLERRASDAKTTYPLRKLVSVWLNGFTAYSLVPLRIASVAGFFCAFTGFGFMSYTIVHKLNHPEISIGYSSLMSVILFMFGVALSILGIMGEYVGRIYLNMSNLPQSVIRESVSSEK